MKILHVNHLARFQGGVERILFDTARGLANRGNAQALLYAEQPIDIRLTSAFQDHGVTTDLIDRFKPDVALIHKADGRTIADVASKVPSVRMVHDHDLVCLRGHKYFPISKQICDKPAGLSCLQHLCFIQPDRSQRALPLKLASLKAQKKLIESNAALKRLIVGSEWMKSSLMNNGFHEQQIAIVPPIPSSLDALNGLTQRTEVGKEFLFVGQLLRGKGVDLMIRALKGLQGEWRARFVGEGNFRPKAERLVSALGLESRIQFTGWVDHEQLDTYYRNALALIVPSRWPEPFGMVGLEAMKRSVPVIGFAVGGIADWLKDGEGGFAVDAADVGGLSRAMQRLLDDQALALDLGNSAYHFASEHYSHDRYLKDIENLLEVAI